MQTYTNRSDAKRAALKALGEGNFTIEVDIEGKFFVQEIKQPEPVVEVVEVAEGSPVCPACGAKEHQTLSPKGARVNCEKCNTTYSSTTGKRITIRERRYTERGSYTVEKVRPTKNGVTAPSKGTIHGQLWEFYSANPDFKFSDIKKVSKEKKLSPNTMGCAYYNWRKFNGVN